LEGLRKSTDPQAVYRQMKVPVPKGVPPTEQDIDRYGEFMVAVQNALRERQDNATPQLNDLESGEHKLTEVARMLVPNPSMCNRARIKARSDRDELLQALASN